MVRAGQRWRILSVEPMTKPAVSASELGKTRAVFLCQRQRRPYSTACAISLLAANATRFMRLLGDERSRLCRRAVTSASPAFRRASWATGLLTSAPNQNGRSANGSAYKLVNSVFRRPVRRSPSWHKENSKALPQRCPPADCRSFRHFAARVYLMSARPTRKRTS